MTQTAEIVQHSFYIVMNEDELYFKGFNPELQKAEFVENPFAAKMFMGKPDIKLRPNESIVEVYVDISSANASLSAPFRPRRRPAKPHA
jgi:hypothetical protein